MVFDVHSVFSPLLVPQLWRPLRHFVPLPLKGAALRGKNFALARWQCASPLGAPLRGAVAQATEGSPVDRKCHLAKEKAVYRIPVIARSEATRQSVSLLRCIETCCRPALQSKKVRPMRIFTHWADFFCLFNSRLFLVYIFHHVLHAAVQQPAKLIYRVR